MSDTARIKKIFIAVITDEGYFKMTSKSVSSRKMINIMGTNDTKGAKNRVEWLYFLYNRIAFKAVAVNVKMKTSVEREG